MDLDREKEVAIKLDSEILKRLVFISKTFYDLRPEKNYVTQKKNIFAHILILYIFESPGSKAMW
jgi:hypothetical protein